MTRLAHDLLSHLLAGGGDPLRLSVIGLSKNAGKTVTLNQIIGAAAERQLPLGLISTGRDGEEQDAITELPKPRIWAPAGAWIATAQKALPGCTATVAVHETLPMTTPFGPVVIGQVRTAGEVLLIGPGSVKRAGELLGALEGRGARLCLVDGSFDRIAAAAPTITGNVVLAAGAAYSHSMSETIGQVRHVLDVFDLPVPPDPLVESVMKALTAAPVCLVTSVGAIHPLPIPSALGDPDTVLAALQAHPGAVLVLRGALSDRLLMAMVRQRVQAAIVVTDPTHVLVERNLWRRWRRQGGIAYVGRPVKLLAVTTNAYSPVGQDYNPQSFFTEISTLAARPVFDLQAALPHLEPEVSS
jgi:hypothetical protein